jgi:hypothetical protein
MKSISLVATVVVLVAGCGGSSFTSPGQTEGTGGAPGVTGGSDGNGGSIGSSGSAGGGHGGYGHTGGATASGGGTGAGGATASGGSTAAGGATASGGSTGSGGATGTGGGVSTDGGSSRICKDSIVDCAVTEYCAKVLCSEPTGFCRPRPMTCGQEFKPVCGCDGVNYGNDCLRTAHGVSASTSGQCANGTGAMCGGMAGKICPAEGAKCVFMSSDQSVCQTTDLMGTCWVVVSCPGVAIGGTWRLCASSVCYDTCTAVLKGGGAFYTDATCPQ